MVIMGKGRQVKLALWKDRPCSKMEPRCPGERLEAGTVDRRSHHYSEPVVMATWTTALASE